MNKAETIKLLTEEEVRKGKKNKKEEKEIGKPTCRADRSVLV